MGPQENQGLAPAATATFAFDRKLVQSRVTDRRGVRKDHVIITRKFNRTGCCSLAIALVSLAHANAQGTVGAPGRQEVASPAPLSSDGLAGRILRGRTHTSANARVSVPSSESLPLTRRSAPRESAPSVSGETRLGGSGALTTVLASLGIVLSVFFTFVWATRRAAPKGLAALPGEVVESLGRAPLAARQQMQLIRLGNRLLLLSVTAQGAETLAEVTDPDEVDRLSGLCQQGRAGSVTGTFRQVLAQFSSEPSPAGFVDRHNVATARGRRRAG